MGKNKLRKFADINSFSNVIQPQAYHTIANYERKGQWAPSFFRNHNPVILEVGCGKGEYTIALAKAFREVNVIGIDIKGDRIWRGAKDALDQGLHNAAFLRIQARNIASFFGKHEVSGIWLTFPDPQSRKVREKKRLTSPWFLEKFQIILAPGSPIHLKTDNRGLFEYTLEVIKTHHHIVDTCSFDLYADNHIKEPLVKAIQTFYEKKIPARRAPYTLHEIPSP